MCVCALGVTLTMLLKGLAGDIGVKFIPYYVYYCKLWIDPSVWSNLVLLILRHGSVSWSSSQVNTHTHTQFLDLEHQVFAEFVSVHML